MIEANLKIIDITRIADGKKTDVKTVVVANDLPPVMVYRDDAVYSTSRNSADGIAMLHLVEKDFGPEAIETLNEEDAAVLIRALSVASKLLVVDSE